jgi:hypothetical protein
VVELVLVRGWVYLWKRESRKSQPLDREWCEPNGL